MLSSFILGLVMGALLLWWSHRWMKTRLHRIPQRWPLTTRPMVNTQERKTWLWLSKALFDHHILIKLPVTRFTAPLDADKAADWYPVLNAVYCTFTVCGLDGKVIACLDLLGPNGASMGNQGLKHSLLDQCGIQYWALDPLHLPDMKQLRQTLLTDPLNGAAAQAEQDEALQVAQSSPNAQSPATQAPAGLQAPSVTESARRKLAPDWDQNSFLSPLGSRAEDPRD